MQNHSSLDQMTRDDIINHVYYRYIRDRQVAETIAAQTLANHAEGDLRRKAANLAIRHTANRHTARRNNGCGEFYLLTQHLPVALRQIVELTYRDHLPEREVRERLGISCHEFRTRLRKALNLVRPYATSLVSAGAGI